MTYNAETLEGFKVLVIDDEKLICDELVEYFIAAFPDCEIRGAYNGKEGVRIFSEWRPQIILTDINMPVMDGLTLARKALEIDKKVKVFIVTGRGDLEAATAAVSLGCFRYILKPLQDMDEFESSLKEAGISWYQDYVTEQMFMQNQKMEVLGMLVGGIAHDFNNLLTPILGFASIGLDEAGPNSNTGKYFQHIHTAGLRAKAMIKSLLTFSRKERSNLLPMNINPLIKEICKLLKATLPASIEIIAKMPAEDVTIFGDATQIHQAIMNLVTNAQYAMKGSGKMVISLSVEQPSMAEPETVSDRKYACITVSDTGCGMDETTKGRIFEPFFSTKPAGEGTGLGLSTTYGIVKNHEGRIEVESAPGRGASFRIYIPLTAKQVYDPHKKKVDLTGNGERIVYVDDEESIVALVESSLLKSGFSFRGFTDSRMALEWLSANPDGYDLLVTDETMPGMIGEELFAAVKSGKKDVRAVICTGNSQSLSKPRAEKLGFREYVAKPFDSHDLIEAVIKALKS